MYEVTWFHDKSKNDVLSYCLVETPKGSKPESEASFESLDDAVAHIDKILMFNLNKTNTEIHNLENRAYHLVRQLNEKPKIERKQNEV